MLSLLSAILCSESASGSLQQPGIIERSEDLMDKQRERSLIVYKEKKGLGERRWRGVCCVFWQDFKECRVRGEDIPPSSFTSWCGRLWNVPLLSLYRELGLNCHQ